MTEKRAEINTQHDVNVSSIDSEMEKEIKDAGGSGSKFDISTPAVKITNEKNIVVKLLLKKQSAAEEKLSFARGLYSGNALDSKVTSASAFVRAQGYSVVVDQSRLANWANSFQALKLAQIYTEMAKRLQTQVDTLSSIETAQSANAALELAAAEEQIRLEHYPAAPPGVSLAQNLEDAKSQKKSFRVGGVTLLLGWFYSKVRNRGDWDYKQQGREFASFGNFNYGATGTAAGIPEAVLLRAAGATQMIAGTSMADFNSWWTDTPYGDDPVDQAWIKAGINYAKSQGY
ncbi:polymorphic toxin type 44 domain-containing protein [Pseudomonas sp. RP23018S]|uniref:polymorphic toxin type 44 domain-containing protein n=1 Tax=Pseudomonas sp. RP23018S TaxID=3096037 RepID=UPI002ACAA751|nr:polymorphic toxin type 44 domain-containing protein [Pseudomonas sp. RP23018S]MDZ5605173.1 polymorphic toxin type 44 domain-containing protein [Pseudomonas sp. RP23018S]